MKIDKVNKFNQINLHKKKLHIYFIIVFIYFSSINLNKVWCLVAIIKSNDPWDYIKDVSKVCHLNLEKS